MTTRTRLTVSTDPTSRVLPLVLASCVSGIVTTSVFGLSATVLIDPHGEVSVECDRCDCDPLRSVLDAVGFDVV